MLQENKQNKQDDEQLRAQAEMLLAQARSELIDLQRALASAAPGTELHARLSAAVAHVSSAITQLTAALSSSIFTMRAADLAAITQAVQSPEVASLTATTSGAGVINAEAAVAASAAYTRRDTVSLEHDVFDDKIFDRYLHFSSEQDEEEFRKRQASAKTYVDAQLAKKTPEGDLNAGGGMVGQMLDEHAHGAGASPEFLPRWNKIVGDVTKQRDAMKAAGQSTAEYDHNIKDSVTRYLKAKGLTNAEIEAQLAKSASPLDAVQPYIKNARDGEQLENQVRTSANLQHESAAPLAQAEQGQAKPTPASTKANIDAISAQLKAAGLGAPDPVTGPPTHGVTIAQTPSANGVAMRS